MIKERYNAGLPINLYFWRDNSGHEVDVIVDRAGKLFPIELKSSHTASDKYLDGIRYWNELSNTVGGAVVYAGKLEHEPIKGFRFINWKNIDM
jgi:predicted AAA+ superfamily ATPase